MLRNFFIPYSGNNYHPHVLHPKRIFFYGLSSIVIKLIVVVFLSLMPIVAWLTPDLLSEESERIILLTNELRKDRKLSTLREDNQLNQAAWEKAQDMLINQYFAHVGPEGKDVTDWMGSNDYEYVIAGENLAIGFADAQEVVDAWIKSKTHYANLVDPNFTEIGVAMVSGAYGGQDTTLATQFLAFPAQSNRSNLTVIGEDVPEINLAEREKNPLSDQVNTKVTVISPNKSERIVKAVAYLKDDAVEAQVNFDNYYIAMSPEEDDEERWVGEAVIQKDEFEDMASPLVPASLTVTDESGFEKSVDMGWDNIAPAKPSLFSQYIFQKEHPVEIVSNLLGFSNVYYKILLFLTSVFLLLTILIEIKKQHPHVILSTLSLIGLLFIFILI